MRDFFNGIMEIKMFLLNHSPILHGSWPKGQRSPCSTLHTLACAGPLWPSRSVAIPPLWQPCVAMLDSLVAWLGHQIPDCCWKCPEAWQMIHKKDDPIWSAGWCLTGSVKRCAFSNIAGANLHMHTDWIEFNWIYLMIKNVYCSMLCTAMYCVYCSM